MIFVFYDILWLTVVNLVSLIRNAVRNRALGYETQLVQITESGSLESVQREQTDSEKQ